MKQLKEWWFGNLKLRVTKGEPERFFSLCQHHGIQLWQIEPEEDGYSFRIGLTDFYQLKSLIKKSKVHLKICEKSGFPFWLHLNRHRKWMGAGILMFFFILLTLSKFVWKIEFVGNIHYTDVQLQKFLKANGYDWGMPVAEAGCEALEKLLRNAYSDITWVSAQIDGTRLVVHIKENDGYLETSEPEASDTPGDLTADHSGRVVSVITRTGIPCVTVGQEVQKGDILISGVLEYKNDAQEVFQQKLVRADGDVLIESISKYEDCIPMTDLKIIPIQKKNGYYLRIGGFYLEWPGRKNPGDQESQLVTETQLCFSDHLYLPVYWGKVTTQKNALLQFTYSEEEAKKLAADHLAYFLSNSSKKLVQISAKNVIVQIMGNECILKADIVSIYKAESWQEIPVDRIILPKESQTE